MRTALETDGPVLLDVHVDQERELLPDDPGRRRRPGHGGLMAMEAGTPGAGQARGPRGLGRRSPAASTSSRCWSRTGPASWPGSPACSAAAASTSTRSRSGRPRTPTSRGSRSPLDGAVHPIDQVTKQLHKLVNVIKIRDMEPDRRSPARWRCSGSTPRSRAAPRSCSSPRSSAAKIVDVSRRTLTIEVTGTQDKIDAFERMVRPHGLIEMARTGEVAIARSRPEQLTPRRSRRAGAARVRSRRSLAAGRRARPPARQRHRRGRRRRPERGRVRLAARRTIAGSAGSSPTATASRSRRSAAPHEVVSRGPGRSPTLRRATAPSSSAAGSADEPDDLPAGAGPLWVGGFAFAADGGGEPHWSSFPPALLVLPELDRSRRRRRDAA